MAKTKKNAQSATAKKRVSAQPRPRKRGQRRVAAKPPAQKRPWLSFNATDRVTTTPASFRAWERRAADLQLPISRWIRQVLDAAAAQGLSPYGPEGVGGFKKIVPFRCFAKQQEAWRVAASDEGIADWARRHLDADAGYP